MFMTPQPYDTHHILSLSEAQEAAWDTLIQRPKTILQSLQQLEDAVSQARQAFNADHMVPLQSHLEEALVHVLNAMKRLEVDPQRGFSRALTRMNQDAGALKSLRVTGNQVEVWANGQCQGQLPLDTEADWEQVQTLARDMGCVIEQVAVDQLQLFT